jgi:hypothetical protein
MTDAETPQLPLIKARPWAVAGAVVPGASLPSQPDVTAGLELFQAVPETEADGYAVWKSAVAQEKAAAEQARRSAELPVHSGADGFARWKEEAEAARRSFEKRWGVPLGKTVRVQLRGESREREGLLRLADEPPKDSSKPLRLILGGHGFGANEIESLMRV